MANHRSDVLIIGAGVIGMSCAYELSKRGISVTVVDKSEPGFGCSYGNAGWITPCFALPLPMPGMMGKILKWLADPVSPVYIKPEPSLLLLKWLLRFIRSMNQETATRSISALTEISKYSLNEYSKLEAELDLFIGYSQKGLLMVSQTDEGLKDAIREMELVARHGISGKFLSEADVKALEPALTGPLKGGVYFPDEAHAEPLAVVRAFTEGAVRNGVKILAGVEVFDFKTENGKIKSVKTTQGEFEADQFVLATGAWSTALSGKLSLDIPILGGKGYALIVKPFSPAPKLPIMILDKKIAITPRENTVRLAGTLELVNQDFSINSRRVEAILRGSQECMNIPRDVEVLEVWRGLRPCTPDGVPIIGYSKHFENLLITAGHQMLGLQSAPGSARLACDLLTKAKPTFDPSPFRATRF